MTTRYDLVQPTQGKDGNTYWTNIGSAFPNKNGEGFSLIFTALPMPGPDGCRIQMRVPKPRDDKPAPRQAARGGSAARIVEDDIPFAAEWR